MARLSLAQEAASINTSSLRLTEIYLKNKDKNKDVAIEVLKNSNASLEILKDALNTSVFIPYVVNNPNYVDYMFSSPYILNGNWSLILSVFSSCPVSHIQKMLPMIKSIPTYFSYSLLTNSYFQNAYLSKCNDLLDDLVTFLENENLLDLEFCLTIVKTLTSTDIINLAGTYINVHKFSVKFLKIAQEKLNDHLELMQNLSPTM